MQGRNKRLAQVSIAIAIASLLLLGGDIKQIEEDQFYNLLELSGQEVEEIMPLPRVKLNEPFVLTSPDIRVAVLAEIGQKMNVDVDDSLVVCIRTLEVLYDHRRGTKK